MAKPGKAGRKPGAPQKHKARRAKAAEGQEARRKAKNVKRNAKDKRPGKKRAGGKAAGKGARGKAAKGAGKGAGGKASGKGTKRKAAGEAGGAPPEKAPKEEAGEGAEAGKKAKKQLTPRQKRRKEVTSLYAELINPGRTRKAERVVSDILELLAQQPVPIGKYCSKYIGSRVVQACLKWGTHEQRRSLLNTMKEHVPKMTTDRYGHVVVLKLLRYVSRTSTARKPTEEERRGRAQNLRELLQGFQGKTLQSAFFHRFGCRVINGIYFSEAVGTKEKRRLLQDVAVPSSVSLTRTEVPGSLTLRQLMQQITPEQRSAVVEHLQEAVDRVVDKELLSLDVVHLLLQLYCEEASEEKLRELAEKSMPGAPYLLSSKAGAEVVLRLLGVATAKQRKAFCRDLKGKFHPLAMNGVDYVVMMRLATTVDDTVLLAKTMLAEWSADLPALCFDKYGHRVLAWLFRPNDTHLFSPYERQCLALPAPSSVKAPETRRVELMRTLKTPLRAVLLDGPLKAAADINAKDVLVAYLAADWDAELVEALVKAGEEEAAKDELGLLGSGTATTTLLVLLKLEPAQAEAGLAAPLWERCLRPRLAAAATSRCAFVLLALLKQGGAVGDAVRGAVRQQRKELSAAVKATEAAGKAVAGAQKLLAAAEGEGK